MTDSKISERVSIGQCRQAIDALISHVTKFTEKKAESQLLPDAEPIFWLTIALKKQPESSAFKVFKIPVAHPIVDPRKESVCLFTKEPQRTYKDLIADNDIKFINRVIDISKLKGKFKAFDTRRALLKQHGLFLADDRILPLLPKLLGSKFFEAKKQPLPVTITRKDLKAELECAISSTYMPNIRGTSISIKIGRLSQKPSHILDNLKTALPVIAEKINGGWDNIQSLGLKTSNSINLPLWTCQLTDGDGGRWTGLTAVDQDADEDEDEDVEMDGDDESSDAPPVVEVQTKGKKRTAAADEDEGEKPHKKSKSSTTTKLVVDETPSTAKSKKKSTSGSAPTPANTPATAPNVTVATPATPTVKKKKSVAVEPKPKSMAAPAPAVIVATTDASASKKSKKARASEGAVPVEETSTAISEAPKEKKKKTADSAAAVKKTPETLDATGAKSKAQQVAQKAAKKETVPVQDAEKVDREVEKVDGGRGAVSQKKAKKAKTKAGGDDGAALPVPSSVEAKEDVGDSATNAKESKKEKKEKKGKKSTEAPAVIMDIDATTDRNEEAKKEKKTKSKPTEQTPVVASTSLSKDELKQKKTDTPGEKKKEKVVKTKTGKSAKASLLGKKVI